MIIADRGYDANQSREMVPNPAIPGRRSYKIPITYDKRAFMRKESQET